ncbi:hypothetical protein [Leisingera sp.]|nr:hypothetical protein [Leisingera sp.]
MTRPKVLRRQKKDPCADFWHTLRIGLAIFVLLILILPKII